MWDKSDISGMTPREWEEQPGTVVIRHKNQSQVTAGTYNRVLPSAAIIGNAGKVWKHKVENKNTTA